MSNLLFMCNHQGRINPGWVLLGQAVSEPANSSPNNQPSRLQNKVLMAFRVYDLRHLTALMLNEVLIDCGSIPNFNAKAAHEQKDLDQIICILQAVIPGMAIGVFQGNLVHQSASPCRMR